LEDFLDFDVLNVFSPSAHKIVAIGSGIVQTSKSQIVFEIIWVTPHNYVLELANYNRQVVVPMNVS
jgi:hypothetical protein